MVPLVYITVVNIYLVYEVVNEIIMAKKSIIWEHFLRKGDLAKCNISNAAICCKGGCTCAMRNHWRSKDQVSFNETKEIVRKKRRTQPVITHCTKKGSLAEILSKMAAIDGFSLHSIVKSEFIRTPLRENGYAQPICPKTAASCVSSFCKSIKENFLKQFTNLILNGTRFAISIDEYTSTKSRRFTNINLHMKEKFWNLGMQRMIGSMLAERVVDLVSQKLIKFGIDLN